MIKMSNETIIPKRATKTKLLMTGGRPSVVPRSTKTFFTIAGEENTKLITANVEPKNPPSLLPVKLKPAFEEVEFPTASI